MPDVHFTHLIDDVIVPAYSPCDLVRTSDSLRLPAPPLDAWMGKACMFCRIVYDAVPCAEGERHNITHGVCPECLPTAAAKMGMTDPVTLTPASELCPACGSSAPISFSCMCGATPAVRAAFKVRS